MIDRLPAQWIAVHDHTETFFAAQFQRQALGREQNVPGQCLVVLGEVVEGAHMFFRDHQKMHGCLRGVVVEGHYLVVLVNDLRRDVPVNDLAKNTLSIHSGFSNVWTGLSVLMGDAPAQCFTVGRIQRGQ
ncbi:hypothetical protein D3C84_945150 [compost metagenome]